MAAAIASDKDFVAENAANGMTKARALDLPGVRAPPMKTVSAVGPVLMGSAPDPASRVTPTSALSGLVPASASGSASGGSDTSTLLYGGAAVGAAALLGIALSRS